MLRKYSNLNIETQLIKNNKPIDSTIKNEQSLDMVHKFRALRDVATDQVINTFFGHDFHNVNPNPNQNYNNAIRRNLFIMYVYDYFDLNIISEFQHYLITNNCEIINNESDYIHFLFKGGNMYFNIILDLINRHNILNYPGNPVNPVMRGTLLDNFRDYFSVSDFDYMINLYCKNYEKFLKIKEHLIVFIIKKLQEITIFFNSYLVDILSTPPQPPHIEHTLVNNTYKFTVTDMAGIVAEPRINNVNSPLNTNNTPLTGLQDNTLTYIDVIENYMYRLNSNTLFLPFLNACVTNTNPIYNFNTGIVPVDPPQDFLEYYARLLSDFEITKIVVELREIIFNIKQINRLLNRSNFINLIPINNKIYNAKIINIYLLLNHINSIYPIEIFRITRFNFNNFKLNQNNYFINLQNIFRDINFYSDPLIRTLVNNMINAFNNKIASYRDVDGERQFDRINIFVKESKHKFLFKRYPDYTNETNFEIIKLKRGTQADPANENPANRFTIRDIDISSRNDLVFQKDNYETNFYLNEKNNNFHYITYNSSINVCLNKYSSIINFDLIRSKLNFTLNNIFIKKYLPDIDENWETSKINVPSEFIDISIPCFDDTFYTTFILNPRHYLHTYNYNLDLQNIIGTNNFDIKSLNVSYFIHDLISILFTQNVFYPWIDLKYRKRLYRLLFLYSIHDQALIPYLTLINNIAHNMHIYITNQNPALAAGALAYLTPLLSFNNVDFATLCQNIINNKETLKSIRFANNNLYFNQLDELVNCLFFSFNIHQLYTNNQQQLAFNLINSQRALYNFIPFNTIANYNNQYHNNIINFITDIDNYTTQILAVIATIGPLIPQVIP